MPSSGGVFPRNSSLSRVQRKPRAGYARPLREPRLLKTLLRISLLMTSVLSVAALVAPMFDVNLPHGLDFILQNSPTPQKYLIETMPGGVALLDYNNDGLLDIFLVNGGRITSPCRRRKTSIAMTRATGIGFTVKTKMEALPM